MKPQSLRALVASSDQRWRAKYVNALLNAGCDVHTATDGFQGLNLLRCQVYDLVLMDDSVNDLEPVEFSFNVREVAANNPVLMVAGNDVGRFGRAWSRCNVFFAGAKPQVLNLIQKAVLCARLN